MKNRTMDDDGGVELPITPQETTVVTLRYFHPKADTADGMVEYSQTVLVDRVHLIIEKMDEVTE